MIAVNLLGNFRVTREEGILHAGNIRSEMLIKLLSYLILHRGRAVQVQELAEALWQQDETENPAGALKNLVYRLRSVMKRVWGNADVIVTGKGSYSFQTSERVLVDAEEFERYVALGKPLLKRQDAGGMESALNLYQGSFLRQLSDTWWVIPKAAYYHSLFQTAIAATAEYYEASEQYGKMERICSEALGISESDEQIYYLLVKAFSYQNKYELAADTYRRAEKIISESLGVAAFSKIHGFGDMILECEGA